MKNYRPVCHLVQVGLLVEYAVKDQIIEHFTKSNLFHSNLHDGLANHSTATALIQIHDQWLSAADEKKSSATCLLDQSSAYNLLPHSVMKDKLEVYNFDALSIKWIMSYLGGRSQIVQIETQFSEALYCGELGAFQGSVLAGVLQNINCNDLPACHLKEDASGVVFVDDNIQ